MTLNDAIVGDLQLPKVLPKATPTSLNRHKANRTICPKPPSKGKQQREATTPAHCEADGHQAVSTPPTI